MKKILLATWLIVLAISAGAQEYPVSTGYIEDCGGFLVDNGLSASDYGPNENSTTTICPDGTDDPLVNLYFSSCALGEGDQITIYDGPDTGSPVIGTYYAGELQGLDIYGGMIDPGNVSGCLTVNFTSNEDTSVGSFGAEISCGLPCERPMPVVTSDQQDSNPIRLCIGEEFTLDASQSQFAEGTSLATFTWDFDDGTEDNASWPSVTHSFSEPGAYVIQLYLTDDNECNSAFLPDVLVYVATEPEMTIAADDYLVCVGQEVQIDGSAEPVTWSALPDANFGGALYIPDDQSQCFSDELVFGGFEPGSTISAESDIEFFFINFEHTFMGDLVISFICPNGQSMVVHQQNGGGMHLGQSNEIDDPDLPGIGWDYYWAPDATMGTWADEALAGTTMDNGNGIQALIPGTYSSVQPFSNMIGCPLNGAWTVEVCDMWGADDGFIFDWSVQFADYLYPDLISFTPSIGAGCDSTFWDGEWIVNDGGNCDNISIVPTQPGEFTYLYTAYDDHGCEYSEELVIEAYPGPVPFAGDDAPFCGSPVELQGEVTNPVQGINYTYNWTPPGDLSGANTDSPTVNDLDETTDFVMTVFPSDDPQCIVSDTVRLFIPEVPPALPLDSLEWCAGSDYTLNAPVDDSGYSYDWLFSEDEDGPFESTGFTGSFIYAEQGGYYNVVMTEPVCDFTAVTPFYVELLTCNIEIPNIFTPQDGNAENNSFVIRGLENFPKSTLKVYSRWGALLYESDNYQNNWSPNATDAPDGTYYYVLGVNKQSGMEYFEGYVMITRLRN